MACSFFGAFGSNARNKLGVEHTKPLAIATFQNMEKLQSPSESASCQSGESESLSRSRNRHVLPPEVRKIIKKSLPSVPHIEALLLMHRGPAQSWTHNSLSKRLYVNEGECGAILRDLFTAGFLCREQAGNNVHYRYLPVLESLRNAVDMLAENHTMNLRGITELVHANSLKYKLWWTRMFNKSDMH